MLFNIFAPALLAILTLATEGADGKKQPANSVLLSNVKTLTVKQGAKTSARRLSAIPQLKCIGGSALGLYDVDVMRCENMGGDYDEEK
jgi:SOCE-associated regulatory factor of calcium homoeostasis